MIPVSRYPFLPVLKVTYLLIITNKDVLLFLFSPTLFSTALQQYLSNTLVPPPLATMVGFQHFLVLVFLVGLLFANLCSSTCSMHLDDSCPAQVWQDQYRCIMNQNSLQTIMDCIFVDDSDSAETSVCRPKDSINDPGEEELYTTKKINGKSMLCIVPRSVLVYGPQYRIGGWWPASMAGVLRVCPAYDPNFLNCLCEHNVRQARIAQFALNFKPDSDQNFSCDKFAKRATLPEDILDLSPYNSTSPDIRLQVCYTAKYLISRQNKG